MGRRDTPECLTFPSSSESSPKAWNLTHNYVVADLLAHATVRGIPRQSLLTFVTSLLEVPEVELVWVDEGLHGRDMKLLSERIDKSYSLCDAVSFVLMGERGLFDALTTDHHFVRRLPVA